MTPQGQNWDPNSDVYALNKENMIDWEGNMIDPRHQTRIIIEDLPEIDNAMIASAIIYASESKNIDNAIYNTRTIAKPSYFNECIIANNSCNNVHVVLSSISSIYYPIRLHDNILERRNAGAFSTCIGQTTVDSTISYVLDVDTVNSDDEYSTDDNKSDDDATFIEWDQNILDNMDIDLDALISSVRETTASKPTGVIAKHLSKLWRIDTKTAEKTLDVTT